MSWLPTVVTVAPASEPVTLAEAKSHCRADGSDDDTWLADAVVRARTQVERFAGVKALTQTVLMQASRWCDLASLPVAPIASISSLKYLDTDGAEQTLSTDVYESVLVGLEPHVRLKVNQTWPAIRCVSDAIRLTAVAGEEEADSAILGAIYCAIEVWYDNRSMADLPESSLNCLANYRRF